MLSRVDSHNGIIKPILISIFASRIVITIVKMSSAMSDIKSCFLKKQNGNAMN
jgi:hypothetical protein